MRFWFYSCRVDVERREEGMREWWGRVKLRWVQEKRVKEMRLGEGRKERARERRKRKRREGGREGRKEGRKKERKEGRKVVIGMRVLMIDCVD